MLPMPNYQMPVPRHFMMVHPCLFLQDGNLNPSGLNIFRTGYTREPSHKQLPVLTSVETRVSEHAHPSHWLAQAARPTRTAPPPSAQSSSYPLACLLVDSFCQDKYSDLCLGGHLSKWSQPEPLKPALWRTYKPQGTTLEIHTQPWRRRKGLAWMGTLGTPTDQWVASGTIGKKTSSFGGDLPVSLMRPGEMALQAQSCVALGTHKKKNGRLQGRLLFHLSSNGIKKGKLSKLEKKKWNHFPLCIYCC